MALLFEWDPRKAKANIAKHGVTFDEASTVFHDAMKKMRNDPDLLAEYDFSKGVRGKYAKRYAQGTNVVVIDPDVAEYFPDHDAVNESLRSLIAVIQRRSKAEPAAAKGACP